MKKKAKRITLRTVNNALAEKGVKAVLNKGDDYFYFTGDDCDNFYSSSVMVPFLNDLTLDEWLAHFTDMQKDSKGKR